MEPVFYYYWLLWNLKRNHIKSLCPNLFFCCQFCVISVLKLNRDFWISCCAWTQVLISYFSHGFLDFVLWFPAFLCTLPFSLSLLIQITLKLSLPPHLTLCPFPNFCMCLSVWNPGTFSPYDNRARLVPLFLQERKFFKGFFGKVSLLPHLCLLYKELHP